MENTTQFDLNAAIRAWRESLGHSPRLQPGNLDELESHLRDSVDVLRRKGLAEDEAFLVATRRLGNASVLSTEFAKVNRRDLWLERVFWMLAGVLLLRAVGSVSNTLTELALWAGVAGSGIQLDVRKALPLGLVFGFVQVTFLILCIATVVRMGGRNFRRLHDLAIRAVEDRTRMVVVIIVVSLVFILGSFGFGFLGSTWFLHRLPVTQVGALSYSKSISYAISALLQVIALVTGAILLFRRRTRRFVNA